MKEMTELQSITEVEAKEIEQKMNLRVEITPSQYEELLKECRKVVEKVRTSQHSLIVSYHSLGKTIIQMIPERSFGEGIMERLASDLGVYKQRLYEYVRVARRYPDIEELLALVKENKLTWRSLIRKALPKPKPAEVGGEASYWDNRISMWENAFRDIEKCAEEFAGLSDNIRVQIQGALTAFQESLSMFGFESKKIISGDFSDIKEILKDIIEYDEITGQGVPREKRTIHHIQTRGAGGKDTLDNMIVVSIETHSTEIAAGKYSKETLRQIVADRNEDLLFRFLKGQISVKE